MSMPTSVQHDIATLIQAAHASGRDTLYEHEVYEILHAMGLTTPRHLLVTHPDDITQETLWKIGSDRLVIKIVSSAITHKEEAGGVLMLPAELDEVKGACARMLDAL